MRPKRIEPGPGQESVWDYPRPPRVESSAEHITVAKGGAVVVDTIRSMRILETSQPPAYYFAAEDVVMDHLVPSIARTFCEWKGEARYFDFVDGDLRIEQVAWTYPGPSQRFAGIAGHLAFYAQKMDCTVDGEPVDPNEGSFYGGWITSKVVGPFKGGPGSLWW